MADAVVKSVDAFSIAEDCGIEKGDVILKVNNKDFEDVLDFRYMTSDEYYVITVQKKDGEVEEIEVYNDLYEQFGCEFENSLMDKPKTCRNNCIFCFMDQLPPNMRSTMYFKDDDVRLSFLEGNYVTLTNLGEDDIERLCRLKVSPINISVHATEPELRCRMLNNRFAGKLLSIMKKFAQSGIYMNAQVVLCKGINDGENLRKTLYDLSELHPYVKSISVVPVGLTAYRDGLYQLESFEKEDCKIVIDEVTSYSEDFLKRLGTRLVYLADEFYIKAERDIPDFESYEDFPQIENGVGLMATFMYDAKEALEDAELQSVPKSKTIATSEIAYDYICGIVDAAKQKFPDLNVQVHKIANEYFGGKITVTGLLCGCDIINQLKNKELGEYLMLSSAMFKDDCDILLDNTTREDMENALGVKTLIATTGDEFIVSLLS